MHAWTERKNGRMAAAQPVRSTPRIFRRTLAAETEAICACGGGCPSCSARFDSLDVSTPGDAAEHEASRIAESAIGGAATPGIARGRPLQPSAELEHPGRMPAGDIVGGAHHSPGEPLDATTRDFMGARLGEDFARVQVHASPDASASARSLAAQAYTVGEDIVFGAGCYAPESPKGRRLLAHELVHVMQQRRGATLLQRQGDEEEAG